MLGYVPKVMQKCPLCRTQLKFSLELVVISLGHVKSSYMTDRLSGLLPALEKFSSMKCHRGSRVGKLSLQCRVDSGAALHPVPQLQM